MFGLPKPESLVPPVHPWERLPEEWVELMREWGEPKYRGEQIFRWLHQRGVFLPELMSDLPKTLQPRLREYLAAHTTPSLLAMDVAEEQLSEDGTKKLLVRFVDQRTAEAVLIPMPKTTATPREMGEGAHAPSYQGWGGDEDGEVDDGATDQRAEVRMIPVTQCISSQVGCAMGCGFCASGIAGLKRSLTAAEIVGQVLIGRSRTDEGMTLRNVVFMGMGEPLHNYDQVARALTLLVHPHGLGLSKRRVTVSTSGLVPEIDRLGRDFDGQVQLAISLHAVDDDRRSSIMPINKKYPIAELILAMKRYPMSKRRSITIEYTLIEGFNSTPQDARALARLLRGISAKVNVIPMNPIEGNPLQPPSWDKIDVFQNTLWDEGVPNFVRRRKGDDIAAACGQLALRGELRKVKLSLPTLS